MVQYQVQFKPVNPINNKPITNESAWDGSGSTTAAHDYDCILYYDRTSWSTGFSQIPMNYIPNTNLKKIPHIVWCVFSVVDTVKQAIKIAKPLMQEYGIDNVQIVKVVPASTEIIFESNNG